MSAYKRKSNESGTSWLVRLLRTPPTATGSPTMMVESLELRSSNEPALDEEYGGPTDDDQQVIHQWAWWRWDYLLDWGLIIVLALVGLTLTHFVLEPTDRFLPQGDPSVTYPLLPDIVPTWSLALIDVLVPVAIFGLWQAFLMRSSHDFHHACLGLAQALIFTLLFTEAVKVAAGRYRPDWQARIVPGQSESVLRDGRQSFPSGHSSIAFAGMVFLSLWLSGKTGLFRHHGGTSWKAVVALIPIAIATTVAVSRVVDYHHNFSDILAGSLLGSAMAIFCYLLNYHPLTGTKSHLPKLRTDHRIIYYHYYSPSTAFSTD